MKDTKFYIGPMSKNIVDAVIEVCEEENLSLGLIPSRRQIEYNGGYVNNWKTLDFFTYVRNKTDKVILQRDHGGRLQGDKDCHHLSSFEADAKAGFDLIHVDPWKKTEGIEEAAHETIKNIRYCNMINPRCLYEVGTEEAIQKYTYKELDTFLNILRSNLDNLWTSIKYAVIQSGTRIIGTENVGVFDEHRCKEMIKVCNKYGLLSKEHNGDYLTTPQKKKRFEMGVSAINIAPEFGVCETDLLLKKMSDDDIEKMYEVCFLSKRWKKWTSPDFDAQAQKVELIRVCAHYVFADPRVIEIKKKMYNIDSELKTAIKDKISFMCGAVQ